MSQEINPDDIFVAVMGMTGAGKSTFISRCAQDLDIRKGHNLISCTSHVSIHTVQVMGRTLHLIDTPGFDDSERPDIETLQELAYWLTAAYERKFQLNGIVYLHRISDTRLQGSALRSLNAFKKMCGEEALGGVVLATTMWDTISPEDVTKAVRRHEELQRKLCHDILENGGRVVALSAAEIDGMKILRHIVQRDIQVTLRFQQQLMVENMLVHETNAGQVLLGTTGRSFNALQSATRGSHRLMTELVDAGYPKDAEDAHEAVTDMTEGVRLFNEDIESTRVTLAEIRKKWERNLANDDLALEVAWHANEERLSNGGVSLPPNRRSEDPGCIFGECVLGGTTELSTKDPAKSSMTVEFTELMRERQALTLTMETRLNRRHTHYERISPRVGIIGTGLALGQLVATLACTVM